MLGKRGYLILLMCIFLNSIAAEWSSIDLFDFVSVAQNFGRAM